MLAKCVGRLKNSQNEFEGPCCMVGQLKCLIYLMRSDAFGRANHFKGLEFSALVSFKYGVSLGLQVRKKASTKVRIVALRRCPLK